MQILITDHESIATLALGLLLLSQNGIEVRLADEHVIGVPALEYMPLRMFGDLEKNYKFVSEKEWNYTPKRSWKHKRKR